MPRNFPGRSGTREDQVYLCQPGDRGGIGADRRDHRSAHARHAVSADLRARTTRCSIARCSSPPLPADEAARSQLEKGPNIRRCRMLAPLPDAIDAPVLLKLGDDMSTDEICPPALACCPTAATSSRSASSHSSRSIAPIPRARSRRGRGHVIVAGNNYGQGSSREHAALAPRFLGLRAVVAEPASRASTAQNLVNFGVLPLTFVDPGDYAAIEAGDVLRLVHVRRALAEGAELLS